MRWLTVDPGEETGLSIWEDDKLVEAQQMPLWEFIDWLGATQGLVPGAGPGPEGMFNLVVCEDWALYPWMTEKLAWDKCRTARGIGAVTFICRHTGTDLVFQPAAIKDGAVGAGAEVHFLRPRHPNRHANDAIMHGVYYLAMQGTRVA